MQPRLFQQLDGLHTTIIQQKILDFHANNLFAGAPQCLLVVSEAILSS
jgi:hypothetical protein